MFARPPYGPPVETRAAGSIVPRAGRMTRNLMKRLIVVLLLAVGLLAACNTTESSPAVPGASLAPTLAPDMTVEPSLSPSVAP
jgi:hypothetical protein